MMFICYWLIALLSFCDNSSSCCWIKIKTSLCSGSKSLPKESWLFIDPNLWLVIFHQWRIGHIVHPYLKTESPLPFSWVRPYLFLAMMFPLRLGFKLLMCVSVSSHIGEFYYLSWLVIISRFCSIESQRVTKFTI